MIYSPRETGELLHLHLEHLADEKVVGLSLGFKSLENYLLPLMDGDLGFILARPGGGKTALLLHIARIGAEQVVSGLDEYGPPIFISNEMPIEELQLRQLSFHTNIDTRSIRFGKNKNDWEMLHTAVEEMNQERPIAYIGASLYDYARTRRMTVETIQREIDSYMQKHGKRPRVICIDYLQRMLTSSYRDNRRLALNEVVEICKDIALDYKMPVVVGSQAGREVDTEKFPVPDTRHGKETGSIEEAGDWVISGMRPSKYYKIGEPIPHSGKNIIVTEELYFIKVLKQRSGEAGRGAWVTFDPRISYFSDLEIGVDE